MIFANWFKFQPLSAGDWPFLFAETIKSFSFLPASWSYVYSGIGGSNYSAGLGFFFELTSKILNKFAVPWFLTERLIWFWPFLLLTLYSSWSLSKTLFPKERMIRFLSPLIYLFNSYILMLVGGGQMGVALAYSLAPLVFALFIKIVQKPRVKQKLATGLVLALQFLFDPRIMLITLLMVLFYAIFQYRLSLKKYLKMFFLPFLLVVGFHSFWLLPTFLIKGAILPRGHGNVGWVGFFSFADFSDTLGLLHPNWPENIFGKTYLMRPEFLIFPILAFGSLLFLNKKKSKNSQLENLKICNFALLALLGAFLAKGTNPPFGQVYAWLFEKIPGMRLFRDPTKFYIMVSLAYSNLIAYSLGKIL